MPQYDGNASGFSTPDYYNCFEGDGNVFHWLQINWEDLEVEHYTKNYISSHQSIKVLDTTATTAQSTSSSEAINGSGTITLHKVAKTGTYSDLIGTPTIPTSFNLIDDILDGSANKYAPYASSAKAAGRLYSGTTNPTNTTRLNYDGYFYAKKVYSEGAEVKTVDTNYYPTAMSWANGTTAGPTATITMSGTSNISVGAIPTASSSQSGIVTTGNQSFSGDKTFTSSIEVTNGASGSSLRKVQIVDHDISFYVGSTAASIQYDDTSSSDGIRICGANLISKDGCKDLGTSSQQWRNLYLSGSLSDGTNSITVAQIGKVKSVNSNTPDANGNVSISIPTSFNLTDNILDGSANKYEPYSSTTATSTWVGTDANAGKLYLGTQNPSKTTRLNYNGYLYATKLYSGGAEVKTTDNDHYPTSFSWTNGTTSGPTGSLSGNSGFSAVSFGAIPTASSSQSGIVTTSTQTFAGQKTFTGDIIVEDHAIVAFDSTSAVDKATLIYNAVEFTVGNYKHYLKPASSLSASYTLTLPATTGTLATTDYHDSTKANDSDVVHKGTSASSVAETIYGKKTFNDELTSYAHLRVFQSTSESATNKKALYITGKTLQGFGSNAGGNVKLTWPQDVPANTTYTLTLPQQTGTVAIVDDIVNADWNSNSGKSQILNKPTLGTAAAKAYTTSVTSGSADLVTSGAVYSAISDLPKAMIFRGTLGTGGTITSLPTASASVEGDTYKVITAGTYASQAAKVGDVFICGLPTGSSTYSWILIPSGDEPSGTVTSIATGAGLTGGTITSSGTIKANLVNETKSSNAASYTAGGSSKFYAVQIDKNDKLGVYVPWSDNNDNYYHSTGSWSGTTYTATANGGAPALAFTLPDATTSAKGVLALSKDNLNTMINQLDTGSSTPVDADYYISQYVSGGTTTTTYHRRPMSALWSYVKGKADSVYAPISHASSATTYGIGTTSNYGHVKLATGDMNGATHVDGVAVSKNHTHSQYVTSSGVTSITINTSGTGISVNSTAAVTSTGTRTITLDSSAEGNRAANKVVIAKAAGQINSEKYAVTSSGTAKATMQYNSTEDCIEFIFA